MNERRFALPTDPKALSTWADDFATRYGVLPIGGGEVAAPPAPAPAAPAAPAAASPPAPAAPDPGPAAPAGGGVPVAPAIPAPGQQPAAPDPAAAAQQPQQGVQGQPADPAAGGDDTPQWAQRLLAGMDQLQGPPQMDPLAAELFGFGQPQAGIPGVDPAQAAQQGQQGVPQQQPGFPQGLLPGQQPGVVDPAAQGQPGAAGLSPEHEAVLRMIDERAQAVAADQLQKQVLPILQQQESLRQRGEWQQLFEDYPEIKDPNRFNAVVNQAKAWAAETLGDASKVREPGYFETVLLAMKGHELTRQAQQQAQPGQQQAPGAAGEVPIEGAGGGNPGGAVPQQTELAQQIVDAGPGGGLNSLWV